MSILFFSQHFIIGKQVLWSVFRSRVENSLFSTLEWKTVKIKKAFCCIHLTNWLDSRFFHYKFPFSNHIVWKIENLVTDLPSRLRLGWQNCHSILIFQTQTPGKLENYSVKAFCAYQIWQIYITKYYLCKRKNDLIWWFESTWRKLNWNL